MSTSVGNQLPGNTALSKQSALMVPRSSAGWRLLNRWRSQSKEFVPSHPGTLQFHQSVPLVHIPVSLLCVARWRCDHVVMTRLHLIHVARVQVVATCIPCRRIVSCVGDKIVVTAFCIHLYPRVEHLWPATCIWCKRGLRLKTKRCLFSHFIRQLNGLRDSCRHYTVKCSDFLSSGLSL